MMADPNPYPADPNFEVGRLVYEVGRLKVELASVEQENKDLEQDLRTLEDAINACEAEVTCLKEENYKKLVDQGILFRSLINRWKVVALGCQYSGRAALFEKLLEDSDIVCTGLHTPILPKRINSLAKPLKKYEK